MIINRQNYLTLELWGQWREWESETGNGGLTPKGGFIYNSRWSVHDGKQSKVQTQTRRVTRQTNNDKQGWNIRPFCFLSTSFFFPVSLYATWSLNTPSNRFKTQVCLPNQHLLLAKLQRLPLPTSNRLHRKHLQRLKRLPKKPHLQPMLTRRSAGKSVKKHFHLTYTKVTSAYRVYACLTHLVSIFLFLFFFSS